MLKNKKHNLIYFIVVTLLCGWIGVAVDLILTNQPEGERPGMGIWLVLPLICAVIFRIREKEWRSFGLPLNIRKGWKGYLIAVFIYPLVTIITVLIAACFGYADIAMPSWSAILSVTAVSFAGCFVKNIFEEFAWRGYLTPRLLERDLNDWLVYGISGLVWGLWHGAYYMVLLSDKYFASSSRMEVFVTAVFIMLISIVLSAMIIAGTGLLLRTLRKISK